MMTPYRHRSHGHRIRTEKSDPQVKASLSLPIRVVRRDFQVRDMYRDLGIELLGYMVHPTPASLGRPPGPGSTATIRAKLMLFGIPSPVSVSEQRSLVWLFGSVGMGHMPPGGSV